MIKVKRVNLSLWEAVPALSLCLTDVTWALAHVLVPKMHLVRVSIEIVPVRAREGG